MESKKYLLQHPETKKFFCSINYWETDTICIPVLFGAEEFKTVDEALAFKNSNKLLENFKIIERKSIVTITEISL